MKIIINSCYGGFGISKKAEIEYLKRKGKECFFYRDDIGSDIITKIKDGDKCFIHHTFTKDLGDTSTFKGATEHYFYDREIPRDDKDLVIIVEEMGKEANGNCADLTIVEIPDGVDYEIEEYDGSESVHEVHRSWS